MIVCSSMMCMVDSSPCVSPFPQAFANEKVFGVLSETLYTLLQLVSVILSDYNTTEWSPPQIILVFSKK